MSTQPVPKPKCTLAQALHVRDAKVRKLRAGGYRRVSVDADGRIVVEVDEARYDFEQHEMFRRAWGPEWPVVRSAVFDAHKPPQDQFEFRSREF